MTSLTTVSAGTGAITDINDNFLSTSPAAMYARRASATSGLTWGFYGGIAFGATIANGTVSLTASNTNYVVAARSTGAVSVSTSNTNWNNTTDYYRLYQVVAGSAAITSYTDYRDFTGGGAGGGSSLTNWTESVNTSAPNATIPAVQLIATNAATNVDAVISPKGTGAVLSQVPDSSATGGNKRGANAVDMQTKRNAAAQVASGPSGTIGGGERNTASGTNATVPGGFNNVASGQGSIASGQSSTASGASAVALGGLANASAANAVAIGNTVDADGIASSARGINAKARGIHKSDVWGFHEASKGQAQAGNYYGYGYTTDATPKVLTSTNAAGSAVNQITLSNNTSAYAIVIYVTARQRNSLESKAWEIKLAACRNAAASSVTISGAPVSTVIGESAGATSWTAAVSADTTNGAIAVTGTGAASTSIGWAFRAMTVEIEAPP